MFSRTIKFFTTILLTFIATLGVVCFTQTSSHAQTQRPRTPSRDDVMKQRMSPTYRRDERDYERQRIEDERRREMQAAQAAEKKRIEDYMKASRDRKTDGGFQTSDSLEAAIANVQPGQSIELYGDLFTAFDGVILSATYYPGKDGKESVPVVLLHDKGGNRRDFDALVAQLVGDGNAVLVPDLRGHGKSKEKIVVEFGDPAFFPLDQFPSSPFWRQWLPERWMRCNAVAGKKTATKVADTDASRYEARQFDAMALFDTQVWQNFLTYENNQERLNIKKLAIVGIGMGARVGSIWAKFDGGSQTKNLILISPVLGKPNAIGGFSTALFSTIRNNISTMIIIGGQNEIAVKDAEAIKKVVMGKEKDDENEPEIMSKCPLIKCNTDRQGVSLFGTSAKIEQGISVFINNRLAALEEKAAEKKNNKTLTWTKLKF